ncbi:MAG: MaoC family dehydratase N-terminal domain-containing protein [Actinomycetota bacterium]|nr:MaoC family dehydratase N-terminal domain-containing protein [Actinomycetota bacterium]
MTTSLISDEMRGAVGTEMGRSTSFPISESDIRKWALAVYYPEPPPPLFWDAEYAATTRYGGIVAPEDFNPFAWLTPHGPRPAGEGMANTGSQEARLGIAPPPVRFGLNGGTESEFGVRMRPGDEITNVTRLHSYTEREGRLGVMLFTISESTWTNQNDELVKVVRQTSIRY